jgi:histone H1/5
VKVVERKVEPVAVKQKAAPAKKAGASKKVRVAAKRAQPARAKTAGTAAKKPVKKAAPARASRPAARRKTAKKR